MNKIIRTIFIVVVILVFLVAFSPSYNSLNIDNLAYVVGLGIDFGENEKYRISFQFSPKSSQSSSDTGSSSQSNSSSDAEQNASSTINTVEAPSIDMAINLMNSYLAKKINLSHCKVVVFSEEVAYSGISDEIYTLTNNSEVRPSTNIIISKDTAKNYLDNSSPILENMITKYYEIFPNSTKYTGYTYDATLGEFFNSLVSIDSEPVAILGGVNSSSLNNLEGSIENSKSSQNALSGLRESENIGLAVFKEGNLIGELNASETLCFSIIKGDLDSFLIRTLDPDDDTKYLDLIVFPKKSSVNVKIVNNSPFIEYNSKFVARIHSMDQNSKYLDSNTLNRISNSLNEYLTNSLTDYLYKTSLRFKSDINGFGEYALLNFLTIPEFEKYNWKDSYEDSIFKVNLDTMIDSSILITET